MKEKRSILLSILLVMILCLTGCGGNQSSSGGNNADQSSMPNIITWTSYDIGGTAYIQSAAIAGALKKNNDITLRVIPSGTDMARLSPVRNGTAHFFLAAEVAYT
ncbi:MAG: hypothetical protein ACOX0E_02840 [Syntrophomonadaceae bacterium]|jgi:ABC-type glycerol-3-phosphate transport system substrate-binding protein